MGEGTFANAGWLLVQGDVYKNNHFVFVKSVNTTTVANEENFKAFWVARILQVRAQNSQHVYALVGLFFPK